jgi:hypothetical protein
MTGTLHEDRYTFLVISRSILLAKLNILNRVVREHQNTHFMFNNILKKSCRLWDNVKKYSRAGQVIGDSMAHAHCILDTCRYKHTLTISNSYWFSAATVVARIRLHVTSHLICLSCYPSTQVFFHVSLYRTKRWYNSQCQAATGSVFSCPSDSKSLIKITVFPGP